MPMSPEAVAGLRAAVTWNPTAARFLADILKDLPIGVRYKPQDRYGPLSIMLYAVPPVCWVTPTESIPITPPPLSPDDLRLCEIFNTEWLQRRFTKQELASAIEAILAEIDTRPLLEQVEPDMFLVFNAKGTLLLLLHPDDDAENDGST